MRSKLSSLKNRPQEEPSVNLTPLIDVVFVILIMFIVIAPLLEMDRVQLADGPSSPDKTLPIQESSPLAIHVLKDNAILFNQHPVDLEELRKELLEAKQRFPKSHPLLFHDRDAPFGTYQSIKNAVEAAGFSQMDVILRPEVL